MSAPTQPEPILRTLAPLLRSLEGKLRTTIDDDRKYKFDLIRKATLEGIVSDLHRKAQDLDVEQPLLIVMLMGGTGVGKSTLLNALAGAPIAQAAVTRPTTRDPVVYFHESVRPDRLDPALRRCRLQQHDRESLRQKVLVDTPDLDSNDLANREKLVQLLPIADIVLYVGSQEKYHDQLGWELFREQRRRRAFAFVLNKWDRCLHPGASGLRPDADLLLDLKREGFVSPLLFRVSAQRWLDQRNGQPPDLPEGEQFADLVNWLEMGLSRLEIEALKARGVMQLLQQLNHELESVAPPDLSEPAEDTRKAWDKILLDEAEYDADVLVGTLDPRKSEIEQHFSVEGQSRFIGPMRWYLKLYNGVQYAGSTLRERVSIMPKIGGKAAESTWDITGLTRECSRVAGERALDKRLMALSNRLLVEAEDKKFPIALLTQPAESAAKLDWRNRFDVALTAALREAEQVWVKPTGTRKLLQIALVRLANSLPMGVCVAAYLVLMWRVFMNQYLAGVFDFVAPLILMLIVLVILQLFIALLLPMRWATIRGEFRRRLEEQLRQSLRDGFLEIPGDVAKALEKERRQIEELRDQSEKVSRWLEERQQQANIAGLYGSEQPVSA
jgi:hypothetical protein